jgi:hypothetical protein
MGSPDLIPRKRPSHVPAQNSRPSASNGKSQSNAYERLVGGTQKSTRETMEASKEAAKKVDVSDDELSFASSEGSDDESVYSSDSEPQIKPKRFCGCCGEERMEVSLTAVSASRSSEPPPVGQDVFLTCATCDVIVHKACMDRSKGEFDDEEDDKDTSSEEALSSVETWHCPKCQTSVQDTEDKALWYEEEEGSAYRCVFCPAMHPHTYTTRMSQSGFWSHGCCSFAKNTEVMLAVCCVCNRSDGAVVSLFVMMFCVYICLNGLSI